jgi:hypothetical protein
MKGKERRNKRLTADVLSMQVLSLTTRFAIPETMTSTCVLMLG